VLKTSSDARLALPQVTLVAVTSVNLAATVKALAASTAQIAFGALKLLSDVRPLGLPAGVDFVQIPRLTSARSYSDFILHHLVDHITTSHCLVVQWDGYVRDSGQWQQAFLDYDYLGASWPQFVDGHDVGNGGFSLRSRRLMEACRTRGFRPNHPEDVAIARDNRVWLETQGLAFAPKATADAFSTERAGNLAESFGFHGVWHLPQLLGTDAFWALYCGLDERSSVRHDFRPLLRQVAVGKRGARRAISLATDQLTGQLMSGMRLASRRKVF
jgi:hypothetical protein